MFWIPSNKPLDLEWLETAPRQLEQQITTLPWGSSVSELAEGLVQRPLLFLPFLLVVVALLWKRSYLYSKLPSCLGVPASPSWQKAWWNGRYCFYRFCWW